MTAVPPGKPNPPSLEDVARLTNAIGPPRPVGSDGYTAGWEVMARVVQRTLDPGGKFDLEIYLSGFGRPDSAKFNIKFPQGFLGEQPSRQQPGKNCFGWLTVEVEYRFGESQLGTVEIPYLKEGVFELNPVGVTVHLNLGPFLPATDPVSYGLEPWDLVPTTGELYEHGKPPFHIQAVVSPKVAPGDYTVPIVLSYLTEDEVKTARVDLEIHVRPFWERRWFQLAVLGLTIATVVASVVAVVH